MSYGGDTEANLLFPSLIAGTSFSIPVIDLSTGEYSIPGDLTGQLYEQVTKLTVADLTDKTVNGTGVFDALMTSFKAHLREEYDKGRITGAEYTKAYVELASAAMSNATQFLLSRDASFWQAQQAQIQAITAKVQLQTAKVQHAGMQLEAATAQANFALTKLKLSTEDAGYAEIKYRVDNILPKENEILLNQNYNLSVKNQQEEFQINQMLPSQKALVDSQKAGQDSQNNVSNYQLSTMLPAQYALLGSQKIGQDNQNGIYAYQLSAVLPGQVALTAEQKESARAQTLDTRSDAAAVTGTMGKQKELYARQIISYQRDSEMKAAKLFTDAWITQKTIDEGLLPPNNFTNTELDEVLTVIRTNNGL